MTEDLRNQKTTLNHYNKETVSKLRILYKIFNSCLIFIIFAEHNFGIYKNVFGFEEEAYKYVTFWIFLAIGSPLIYVNLKSSIIYKELRLEKNDEIFISALSILSLFVIMTDDHRGICYHYLDNDYFCYVTSHIFVTFITIPYLYISAFWYEDEDEFDKEK